MTETRTFETLATLRKYTLFSLRKYINANVENVEPFKIRTFDDCIRFIETHELFTKTGGTSRNNSEETARIKHEREYNRDFTLAVIRSLATGENVTKRDENGNVIEKLTANNLEVKNATHETSAGGRISITFNGRSIMTLFYGLKSCNVAVRDNDFADFLEFMSIDRDAFNVLHEVGTLSYNQPCYLHNFSYETVTETREVDENGNEKIDNDGKPIFKREVSHGNLLPFIVAFLEMHGGLIREVVEIPTETHEEKPTGKANGKAAKSKTKTEAANGKT